jgi:methylated-DNA-[protein]-cysteine S-methyltransferase
MPIAGIDSPVGTLELEEHENQIVRISWAPELPSTLEPSTPILERACSALNSYFAGAPESFGVPLSPAGSEFQLRVWREMQAIPRGETRTYGDLARAVGSAPRAIGMACGANPIPIIIPCHRVIAATGLGGYSGGTGLDIKIFLLRLEGALLS